MVSSFMWEQSLRLWTHTYWERKSQFKVYMDTYPFWVLFAVESGEFRFRIGKESGMAGPGELVFCPPQQPFERETLAPLALHYLGFEFSGQRPQDIEPLQTLKSHPIDGKRLASNFAYLRKLHLAVDARSTLRKQWILNDIWQLACDGWDAGNHRDGLDEFIRSDDERMNQAMQWLHENAYTPFSMRMLSDLLELSPSQLTRRFQKEFRMAPSELVRSLRIRKAAGLLLDTELTLDQIAEKCGYDNGFYLSRIFTRSMGINPSEYRKQNRV